MANFGSGINLGSATIFLLADGSGLRRDLQRGVRDVENFNKKVDALERARTKATGASAQAEASRFTVDATEDRAFLQQQKAVEAQVARTTKVIAESYATRTRAMAAIADASKIEEKIITASEGRMTAATTRHTAALVAQQKIEDKIATGGKGGAPLNPYGASLVRNSKAGVAATQELIAAQAQLARATALSDSAVTRGADAKKRVIQNASNQVIEANRRQIESTRQVKAAFEAQDAVYKRMGDAAGGPFVKLASNVQSASRAVITNLGRMKDAAENLDRINAKLAASPGNVGLIAQQEKAALRYVALQEAGEAAIARRSAAETAYYSKAIKLSRLDATASVEAANEKIAAERAVTAARTQAQATKLDSIGRFAGKAFAGSAIAIGLATQQAVSFEQAMINVASISPEVDAELVRFTADVQDLAVELGKSPTELAEGLYEIAQAGFEGQEAFDILNISAHAAVAGMTSVEEAARPLIGVMNAYHVEVADAQAAMDVMFAGVTEGIFTFEELSSQLGDNISIAQALGVSLEELMAVYTTLTLRSNSLSESTTQVNAVMNSFLKPSEALNNALMEMTGQTAQAYFRSHDLADVLALVNKMFLENADSAGQLFPNIRAIRGVFGLSADDAKTYNDQLALMKGASLGAGAATIVFNRQAESAAFKLSQAREQLREVAIIFGNSFIPAVVAAAQGLGSVAKAFSDLNPQAQSFIGGGFLVVAALTGIALIVTKVATGFLQLKGTLTDLNIAFSRGALAAGLYAAAIAAVILVAIKVSENNQAMKDSYDKLTEAINNANNALDKLTLTQLRATAIGDENTILGGLIFIPPETSQVKDQILASIEEVNSAVDEVSFEGFKLHFADNQALQEYLRTQKETVEWQNLVADGYAAAGADGTKYLSMVSDLQKMYEMGALSGDQANIVLAKQNTLFAANEDGYAREAMLIKLNAAQQDYLDNVEKLGEVKAGAIFARDMAAIDETGIINMAEALAKADGKAVDVTTSVRAFQAAAEGAFTVGTRTAEETAEAIDGLAEAAYIAVGAVDDLSDPLAFLRQQFGNETLTLPQALLDLQAMGEIEFGIDTGGLTEGTLKIAAAMDQAKANILSVTTAIAESQSASSEWAGMQATVADAIGTEADGYARLNAYLDDGVISQAEFNAYKEAGISITNRAIVGQEEERLAQLSQIDNLAQFVEQQGRVKDSYDDLSGADKGRIDALQDQRTQTVLLTVAMFKLLDSMGKLEEGAFDTLVGGLAQDPVIGATLKSLGLLPESVAIRVGITGDVPAQLEAIEDRIQAFRDRIAGDQRGLEFATTEERPAILADIAEARKGIAAAAEEQRSLEAAADDTVDSYKDLSDEALTIEERNAKIASRAEEMDAAEKARVKTIEEEAAAVLEIKQAWDAAYLALEPTRVSLEKMANESIPGILSGIRPGLDDPFAFLTYGAKKANLSFTDLLTKANRFAGINLHLSDEAQEAIAFSAALDKSAASLARVTDRIAEHQSEISRYEGYKTLVEDVLGSVDSNIDANRRKLALGKISQKEYFQGVETGEIHGAYDKVNQMVEEGRITQEQANAAIAAGTYLRSVATQGIADEEAALVLSLAPLARYVQDHLAASENVAALTKEQHGFIAALQDEATQTALSTTLMIAQFEAMGLTAEGATNKAIAAFSKLNPAIGAVFTDIFGAGLDIGKITPRLEVNPEPVGDPLAGVDVNAALERINTARTELDTKLTSMVASAKTRGGEMAHGFVDTVVSVLSTDATKIATQTVSATTAFGDQVSPSRLTGGQVAGAFVNGIVARISQTAGISSQLNASSGPVAIMEKEVRDAFGAGEDVAQSFIDGLESGLGSRTSLQNVERAGGRIADSVVGGTMKGLEASSPAKTGIRAGDAFVSGVRLGLDSGQEELEHAGTKLADTLTGTFGDLTFGGSTAEIDSMIAAMQGMAESEENIDYRQLEGFADALDKMSDPTGRLQRASSAIRGMADSAKTELENISSAGSDFGSNLEYAADQIAAFKGDKTPQQFVAMSLELRKLAESSDQLDATKLRNYADQLRATGDAGLVKTATYLDSIAADVDERARIELLHDQADAAAEAGGVAAGGYMQALKAEIARRQGELSEPLKRFLALPDATRNQAATYIQAALRGDADAMVAEYNRLESILDPKSLDKVARAGGELLRKGLPKGFAFEAEDTSFVVSEEILRLSKATVARQRATEAGTALTGSNNALADSYDRVNSSASSANQTVGSSFAGGGGGVGGARTGGGGAGDTSELSQTLTRWQKLSSEVKANVAAYMRANLSGDETKIIAEYERAIANLDKHTHDLVVAAGAELRTKGVPKGFTLSPTLDLVPMIDTLVASMPYLRRAITDTFEGIQGVAGERQVGIMEVFLANFIAGHRQAALAAWGEITQFMTAEGQRALYELAVQLNGGGQAAGASASKGVAQGVKTAQGNVRAAGATMGRQVIGGVNTALGMASPSAVMGEAGRNAALSFTDQFVRNARQSIRAIRLAAQEQGTAFRETFKNYVQAEDGSYVPTSFYGGKPNAGLGARGLNANGRERQQQSSRGPVTVTAPITIDMTIEGYNQDPRELTRHMKQEIWGELVDGIGRVWSQVEGATA